MFLIWHGICALNTRIQKELLVYINARVQANIQEVEPVVRQDQGLNPKITKNKERKKEKEKAYMWAFKEIKRVKGRIWMRNETRGNVNPSS